MAIIAEDHAQAIDKLKHWRENVVEFVKERFKATPDPWQGDALRLFPKSPRLALQACVGPGKSAVLAWIALNFILTRPKPKIAATSITWPNLRDNLWAECAKWINRDELSSQVIQWTQTKIFLKEDPRESWISARTWDRSAEPEMQAQTMKGLHADYILAIADETGGMPAAVLQAAEGILSSCVEGHIVQAGNPTHLAGALYEATENGRGKWAVLRISGDPDDPNRAPRVDKDWAEDLIHRWGRKNAFVRSSILGLYPLQATDALIGIEHFENAFGRTHTEPKRYDKDGNPKDKHPLKTGIKALGVDVARFGDNETVVCFRNGDFIESFQAWSGKEIPQTVARVANLARSYQATHIIVDDIGVGGGVTDGLRAYVREGLLHKMKVIGVNVGVASKLRDGKGNPRFSNKKSEINWRAAQAIVDGKIALNEEVRDTPLKIQGTDIRYEFQSGGRTLKIEDKEEYCKRHNGESPDYWDAFVLALYAKSISLTGFGWMRV